MLDIFESAIRKKLADVRHGRLNSQYKTFIDRHKSELTIIGGDKTSLFKSGGPIVVFCFRDEALRLPYFLQY